MQKNIFKNIFQSGLKHKMLSPLRWNEIIFLMENPFKSIKSRRQICAILLRRKRTFPHGFENNHACKWILDNFSGKICMSALLVRMVRNPVAFMVVFLSIWKGPNHGWNFIESGSENATYVICHKVTLMFAYFYRNAVESKTI